MKILLFFLLSILSNIYTNDIFNNISLILINNGDSVDTKWIDINQIRNVFKVDSFQLIFNNKNYDYAYKLYCKDATIDNSLDAIQDYVFSQSVLFRHYFLNGNHEEAFTIGTKIYTQTTITDSDLDAIYIFPNIRFRAYKIWYYQLLGKPKNSIEHYVIELLDYCKNNYNSLDSYGRKILFHCIAEVFCFSNISSKYHLQLKNIFEEEYFAIPNYLFEKPLKKSLPYFEPNGLVHYRPL